MSNAAILAAAMIIVVFLIVAAVLMYQRAAIADHASRRLSDSDKADLLARLTQYADAQRADTKDLREKLLNHENELVRINNRTGR